MKKTSIVPPFTGARSRSLRLRSTAFFIAVMLFISMLPISISRAAGHKHNYQVVEVPATCTKAGVRKYQCKSCNAISNTQTIPALGHNYQWTETTPAGWKTDGYQSNKCTRCGNVQSGTTIPSLQYQIYHQTNNPYRNYFLGKDEKGKKINKVADNGSNQYGGKTISSPKDDKPYDPLFGDKPGDNTKNEWAVKDWFRETSNGKVLIAVFRYNGDPKVALKLATLALDAANNDNIGYTQGKERPVEDPDYLKYSRDYKGTNARTSYLKQLRAAGFNPSVIRNTCDCDCSAGVTANLIATGYHMGIGPLYAFAGHNGSNLVAANTQNITLCLGQSGCFTCYTDSKYLPQLSKIFKDTSNSFYKINPEFLINPDYLLPGDILLYSSPSPNDGIKGHVNICVTIGNLVK